MLRRHLKLRLTVASQQHIGIPSRCLLPDDSTSLHHFIAPHHIQTLSKPSQNNNQIKESVNGWNYCVWKECICQIVWVSVLIWKILAFLWRVGEDVTILLLYVTLVLLQKLLTWFLDLYTDAFPFSYSKVPWFLHHEKRKKKTHATLCGSGEQFNFTSTASYFIVVDSQSHLQTGLQAGTPWCSMLGHIVFIQWGPPTPAALPLYNSLGFCHSTGFVVNAA